MSALKPPALEPPLSLLMHALKLVSARPHSREELSSKLLRLCSKRKSSKLARLSAEYAPMDCPSAVGAVLDRLTSVGLINDAEYVSFHVEQRARWKARSKLQLRAELGQKRVAEELSRKALETYDELTACAKAAKRRMALSEEKLTQHLFRKGFPVAVVKRVVAVRFAPGAGEDGGGAAGLDQLIADGESRRTEAEGTGMQEEEEKENEEEEGMEEEEEGEEEEEEEEEEEDEEAAAPGHMPGTRQRPPGAPLPALPAASVAEAMRGQLPANLPASSAKESGRQASAAAAVSSDAPPLLKPAATPLKPMR